ncbi:thioredoxin fold domain-containing protein [bacterium]|nr:thioredoxin fold domain-containing protein [bacterium]
MKLLLALLVSVSWSAEKVFLEDLFSDRLVPVEFKKPTLLTFIQPHCGPCKRQIEALECVHAKQGEKTEIMLVQASGDLKDLQTSLRKQHLPFTMLKGSPKFLAKYAANLEGTPMTVVFDAKGTIQGRVPGAQSCDFWQGVLTELAAK